MATTDDPNTASGIQRPNSTLKEKDGHSLKEVSIVDVETAGPSRNAEVKRLLRKMDFSLEIWFQSNVDQTSSSLLDQFNPAVQAASLICKTCISTG